MAGKYNPSKCGISDYIFLLSDKLYKLQHECNIFSIDKNWGEEFKNLNTQELTSIQFTPYIYSTSRLNGKNLSSLAEFIKTNKVHINFHEIWIGAYPNASLKEKFIGWHQQKEILKFLELVNPCHVTCSNAAAMDRLTQAGIQAKYLYLFGNVPYDPSVDISVSNNLRIALFGTPYEKFPYNHLAERLNEISAFLNKPVELRIIGRQRVNGGLDQIRNTSKQFNFSFSETGELSPQLISKELQSCNLGLCTTPYDILGKSGATAAMLEHGLPVLAFDDGDTPKDKLFVFEQFSDQVYLLDDVNFLERLIAFMQEKRKPFFDGVAHTANKMLELVS